jgi:predicted ATP-dependent endonuclease of OLD family
MHISKIRIRNFRSIEDLTVVLDRMTVFCGPNSCGKSNIFRAIQLSFQQSVSASDAQQNLTASKLVAGGPMLSIWVECKLEDIAPEIQKLAGSTSNKIDYSFRLTRSGGLTRKLGTKSLNDSEFTIFLQHFLPVYVPPIRDLGADGLIPFKRLIKAALQRAKGPGNIKQVSDAARTLLTKKASILLEQQSKMASKILRVDKLSLDTSDLEIESLYENIGLRVHNGTSEMPLSSLGTGHQSAVIMHLYRQLGEDMPGEVLFLFEEPDNHLHPSTIRSICDDLLDISKTSQCLVSTHSPVFLAHAGFQPLRPLIQNNDGLTILRNITLLSQFTEKEARAHFDTYGLRLTEPLLSSRVIVVEGITDKVVLSTLFQIRNGGTIDQADFLLVIAGGKDKVVNLCNLLSCLGVDWRCVMDSDAKFSSEVPYTRSAISLADISQGITAIDNLSSILDSSAKRGRNALNSLQAVRDELSSSRPATMIFQGSPLKTLLDKTKTLSAAEQAQLKVALVKKKKREASGLLGKARTFIWSANLEEVLLLKPEAEDCVEKTLLTSGVIKSCLPRDARRKATLLNKLHKAGNTPLILFQVVVDLDKGGHFNRSEVNECFKFLFPDI